MSSETSLKNPYPGPRPFQPEEQELFFGRDPEEREMISLVYAHRVIFVYAQSGAGKTSLLNAAVCPALNKEGFEILCARHLGAPIPGELRSGSQLANAFVFNTLMEWKDEASPPQSLLNLDLTTYLESRKPLLDEQNLPRPRVLVFDQFEEFFTAFPERWAERSAFFEQIASALAADRFLRILIALREEYLANLDAYCDILPERPATRVRVEPLRRESALLAIEGPLSGTRRRFENGVAETLVDRLDAIRTAAGDGQVIEVPGEFVEPVQLQVVCRSLWEDLPPHAELITQADLDAFGDVNQALSEFYEKAVERVVREGLTKEGELRQWFEHTLITPALTRGMVFRDTNTTGGIPNSVVSELEKLHLIRGETRAGGRWYELTHDRLVEPILQSNSKWRARHSQAEQTRFQLESKASAWIAAGRGVKGLLGADQLDDACRWLESPEAKELGFSESVMTLVSASREELQRQKLARASELAAKQKHRAEEQSRINRRLRLQLSALILSFLAAVIFAAVYKNQQKKAEALAIEANAQKLRAEQESNEAAQLATKLRQEEEKAANLAVAKAKSDEARAEQAMRDAQKQKTLAQALARKITETDQKDRHTASYSTSRVLSEEAISNLEIDPERSLLLALASAFVTYGPYGNVSAEAIDALNHALQSPHIAFRLPGHTDYLGNAVFNPEGTLVAAGSRDGTIRIWDVASAKPLRVIPNAGPARAVAFSPDGLLIAAACADKRIRVWYASSGKKAPSFLPLQNDELFSVAFSPDGTLLAVASRDGTAKIWKMADGKLFRSFNAHEGGAWSVSFSPDGKELATGGRDGTARIWDISSGTNKRTFSSQGSAVYAVAYSPDGKLLAVANSHYTAEIWDISTANRLHVLTGHTNWVFDVAFSPDGTRLATASRDKTAKVWDVAKGTELMTLRGHTDGLNSVDFSPDGKLLATASDDKLAIIWHLFDSPLLNRSGPEARWAIAFSPDGKTVASGATDGMVKIWDAKTGAELHTFGGQWGPVTGVSFSPYGRRLITANSNRTAVEWNASSGREILTVSPVVHCLAVSPDGRHLAVGGRDHEVTVWDIWARKVVSSLNAHTGEVFGVAYSPDGALLASASGDGTVKIWNSATGELLRTLSAYGSAVFGVAFSPDGRFLGTASSDQTARVWEVKSWRLLHALSTSAAGPLTAVAFSPDSRMLAVAGRNKRAELWNWESEKRLFTLSGHKDALWAVAFSPDGKYVATAGSDRKIKLWIVASGKLKRTFSGHTDNVEAVAFDRQGNQMVTASYDSTAVVWNVASGGKIRSIQSQAGALKGIGYSPDDSYLATATYDGTITLWDAHSGRRIQSLTRPPVGQLKTAMFSPDGRRFATAGTDGVTDVWDANSGKMLLALPGTKNYVNSVAFSPDGKFLATASGDSTAKIWDATRGNIRCSLTGSTGPLTSIAYSPKGDRLVTGGDDETARIWDTASCKPKLALVGHSDRIRSVAFSPDGTEIATAGDDTTVRLWNANTGEQLFKLSAAHGEVFGVAFSPHGKRLATASEDGSVRIFSLRDRDLIRLAENYVTRGLTPDECKNYLQMSGGCPPEESALALIAEANQLAKWGDIPKAAGDFERAEHAAPFLRLEPYAAAKVLSDQTRATAAALLTQGSWREAEWFAQYGRIDEAIASLRRSHSSGFKLAPPADTLNSVCWWGSLWNRAADVLEYCEQAVEVDPTEGTIRDSRGVALVLTGQYRRAIPDFEWFIASTPDGEIRQQRRRWLQALLNGRNPLTPDEIRLLKTQ